MIDLHTHLLPGVDDGSPSIEKSLPVLERFVRHGVTELVCTPHLDASRAAAAPYTQHRALLDELRAAAPTEIELHLGWEIMLDVPGADLSHPHLSLGDSRAVLVEFPRTSVPAAAADELFRLRTQGLVPVLAHPERYWGCTPETVARWQNGGAVIQMDAVGPLGNGKMADLSLALLEEGLVDCIASDNHGDSRSMQATRQWLQEMGADEQAELLTATNPAQVLAGEPTLPVPPLPRRARGLLGRLRSLVLGPHRGGAA
jgi:protein-tyrosine phosphatase